MRLSLSNLSFVGFNYAALKYLPADLGIEVFYEFGNDIYWERVMKELYANRPVQNLSIHGPSVGINLADENDIRYMALYKDVFQFAARWDAAFVVVHTNEAFNGEKERVRERIQQRLKKLLAISGDHHVPLLIENVGLNTKGTLLFDWPEYLELLSGLPEAGALIDTGHANINHWNLPDVIKRLGDRLVASHLHDNQGVSDEHLPVGDGIIDWTSVFAAITSFAPESTMVFEYANVDVQTALSNINMVKNQYLNLTGNPTSDATKKEDHIHSGYQRHSS